jgi:hypothetical protein
VERPSETGVRGVPRPWRWPLPHAAIVLILIGGCYLGLLGIDRVPALGILVDGCHSGLIALGLPWSALVFEALGRVDKENEIVGGLRELILFLPACANVAVHLVLVRLRRRGASRGAGAVWTRSPRGRTLSP